MHHEPLSCKYVSNISVPYLIEQFHSISVGLNDLLFGEREYWLRHYARSPATHFVLHCRNAAPLSVRREPISMPLAMGVATHLGIKLREYDRRIRTFIPDYEEMLQTAASVVPTNARRIVDLGIGTGALSSCCLRNAPRARIFGIDTDAKMVEVAVRRLHGRGELMCGNFVNADLPTCGAVVASFALHHVRTRAAKENLYRRIRKVLRPGGMLVNVDCHPAHDRTHASRCTRGART